MSTFRIDYFLYSDDLLKIVMDINIEDGFKIDSNHYMVILDISTNPSLPPLSSKSVNYRKDIKNKNKWKKDYIHNVELFFKRYNPSNTINNLKKAN
jgi:hypothetical protein